MAAARGRAAAGRPAFVVIAAGLGHVAAGAWDGAGGAPIGRRAGQQLARSELGKRMYHPGVPLTVRIENWLSRLLHTAGVNVPAGWWALVALAALLVLAVAVILARIGPVARSRARARDPLLGGSQLSAADHRESAQRLAAAGDFTAAIVESVRAIAVELEERGLLAPRLGRTADELAAEASGPWPAHAAGFRDAARLFDDVRYGGRPGTADGYQRLRDLDAAIRAARPAVPAGPSPAGVTAGPF